MGHIGARPDGLSVHTYLQRSRCAAALARGMALAAGAASSAALGELTSGFSWGWGVSLAAGAVVAASLSILARRQVPAIRAVAVDAGGNWHVAHDGAWRRFAPRRIWRSPLGWLTLAGDLAPRAGGAMARSRVGLTIWFDSVPAADWRRLRMAATWTEQRGQGLQMRPEALDPRLGGAA